MWTGYPGGPHYQPAGEEKREPVSTRVMPRSRSLSVPAEPETQDSWIQRQRARSEKKRAAQAARGEVTDPLLRIRTIRRERSGPERVTSGPVPISRSAADPVQPEPPIESHVSEVDGHSSVAAAPVSPSRLLHALAPDDDRASAADNDDSSESIQHAQDPYAEIFALGDARVEGDINPLLPPPQFPGMTNITITPSTRGEAEANQGEQGADQNRRGFVQADFPEAANVVRYILAQSNLGTYSPEERLILLVTFFVVQGFYCNIQDLAFPRLFLEMASLWNEQAEDGFRVILSQLRANDIPQTEVPEEKEGPPDIGVRQEFPPSSNSESKDSRHSIESTRNEPDPMRDGASEEDDKTDTDEEEQARRIERQAQRDQGQNDLFWDLDRNDRKEPQVPDAEEPEVRIIREVNDLTSTPVEPTRYEPPPLPLDVWEDQKLGDNNVPSPVNPEDRERKEFDEATQPYEPEGRIDHPDDPILHSAEPDAVRDDSDGTVEIQRYSDDDDPILHSAEPDAVRDDSDGTVEIQRYSDDDDPILPSQRQSSGSASDDSEPASPTRASNSASRMMNRGVDEAKDRRNEDNEAMETPDGVARRGYRTLRVDDGGPWARRAAARATFWTEQLAVMKRNGLISDSDWDGHPITPEQWNSKSGSAALRDLFTHDRLVQYQAHRREIVRLSREANGLQIRDDVRAPPFDLKGRRRRRRRFDGRVVSHYRSEPQRLDSVINFGGSTPPGTARQVMGSMNTAKLTRRGRGLLQKKYHVFIVNPKAVAFVQNDSGTAHYLSTMTARICLMTLVFLANPKHGDAIRPGMSEMVYQLGFEDIFNLLRFQPQFIPRKYKDLFAVNGNTAQPSTRWNKTGAPRHFGSFVDKWMKKASNNPDELKTVVLIVNGLIQLQLADNLHSSIELGGRAKSTPPIFNEDGIAGTVSLVTNLGVSLDDILTIQTDIKSTFEDNIDYFMRQAAHRLYARRDA